MKVVKKRKPNWREGTWGNLVGRVGDEDDLLRSVKEFPDHLRSISSPLWSLKHDRNLRLTEINR